jgi:hypothetical protein
MQGFQHKGSLTIGKAFNALVLRSLHLSKAYGFLKGQLGEFLVTLVSQLKRLNAIKKAAMITHRSL